MRSCASQGNTTVVLFTLLTKNEGIMPILGNGTLPHAGETGAAQAGAHALQAQLSPTCSRGPLRLQPRGRVAAAYLLGGNLAPSLSLHTLSFLPPHLHSSGFMGAQLPFPPSWVPNSRSWKQGRPCPGPPGLRSGAGPAAPAATHPCPGLAWREMSGEPTAPLPLPAQPPGAPSLSPCYLLTLLREGVI